MSMLYRLCGGDFVKLDDVLSKDISSSFSWLTFMNRRDFDEAVTFNSSK